MWQTTKRRQTTLQMNVQEQSKSLVLHEAIPLKNKLAVFQAVAVLLS